MFRLISIAALAVASLVCAAAAQTDIVPPEIRKTRGTVAPDIEMVSQDSTTFHLAMLRGKPIVINPVFTSCKQTCSYITSSLRDALEDIGEPGVGYEVLTISFDPADGPQQLREYKDRLSLPDGWRLAVASPADVKTLMDAIGFQYHQVEGGGFAHANVITILDPDMKVASYMYGVMYDADELRNHLERAARDTSLVRKARPLLIVVAALGALLVGIVLIATKKKTA